MRYDAFISYRHGELDGLVAEKLHRMLETYRIPRGIAKKVGKTKLSRIFRDREELPTSSNLSDSINDALENSAFLLLICSRRTQGSQWVMREVERFGELRGKDRIITLLIDGEPDESFPPGLREREVGGETIFVEPLAADIRAATPRRSVRLLKEEKLRLLAPILGCAFDDLRRRHRRRRVRRVASVVSAAFVFALSFGAFSFWQYVQIDRQMQLKLENQSYVLSEYAAREFADGDPDTAVLLALEALPKDLDRPERPLVPAAEKALADALGVYDLRDGFKPHKALALSAAPSKIMLSPGETYAAAVCPFTLTVFDPESGRVLATRPTVRSALADAEFLSDGIILFAGEEGIEAYDIAADETLWRGEAATSVAVSDDGARVAVVYGAGRTATVYDANGRILSRVDFGGRSMRVPADDSFLNPHDALFALDAGGGRLAVSFADGSLSVFNTGTGAETPLYPASGATYFAGAFYGNMLAFSVVEREPYLASYFVYDMTTNAPRAHFTSDAFHFTPCVAADGLYVAFEDQVLSVDTETGGASLLFSVGGAVETLQKYGDDFIVCESAGPYRVVTDGVQATYASDYTCQFAGLGARFALTGSYDAKNVRILKKADFGAADILAYATDYAFSEAKINAGADRVAFYSYRGLRLCDLNGNILSETDFPEPLAVTDTQYDKDSGNVAVLYDDRLLLYSGRDGALLLDARGKPGVKSVLYTPFGVGVLDEGETASLYRLSDGTVGEAVALYDLEIRPKEAQCALPIGGGVLTSETDGIYFGGTRLGEGKISGADALGDGVFAFAVSDDGGGSVFTVKDGAVEKRFAFESVGAVEVYFTGGYIFVSPLHGDAAAYTAAGEIARVFDEKGYLAETGALGDRITASYIAATSERYSLLLDANTLETVAVLPGFLGERDAATLVLDDGAGRLRAAEMRSLRELTNAARQRLDGRVLTSEEKERFKAG